MIFEGREVLINDVNSNVLLIALHGGLGNPVDFKTKIENHLPDVRVVYPSADASKVWKAGGKFGDSTSDLLWLSGLIYNLIQTYNPTEIWMLGHSNGGMMTYRASQLVPYALDGIICISAASFEYMEKITPTLHIHGTDDVVVPIAGNADYKNIIDLSKEISVGSVDLLCGVGHSLDDVLNNYELKTRLKKFMGL